MGLAALLIATTCYAVAAVDLARRGDVPMALVWGCYATANCALTYSSYKAEILAMIRQWQ